MVTIGSKEIPNVINEMTIAQFEKVSSFSNNQELDAFEKWVNIFVFLGADEDEVNEMDFTDFKNKVKEFNTVDYKAKTEFTKQIELENYTYQSFEDEFKLSVRDLKHIEKLIKKEPNSYISKMMAVIFKRTDLSKTEHYADAHINYKSKLFKTINAEICLPFVSYVAQKMTETATQIKENAPTEIVE